jgi:hypothetical protein
MSQSHRQTLGATRARQGRYGGQMVWVLLFGLALAVIGVFAAWAWKSGDLASVEPNNGAEQADVRGFQAPRPDAATRQNYQAGAPLAPRQGAAGPYPPSEPGRTAPP